MKKLNYLMAVMLAAALFGFSSSANAQLANHDLSTGTQSPCVGCHTPHESVSSLIPLWNHETTTGPFTMYSSDTLDGAIAGSPQGSSLACLSCHDGTVGVDNFGGTTGTAVMGGGTEGGKVIGTNLTNDHPISLTFDNGADAALQLIGAVQASSLVLFGAGNDQVECATCHNVHEKLSATGNKYLRIAGSTLCGTCHTQ